VDGGRVREGGRRKRWALMVAAFLPPAFLYLQFRTPFLIAHICAFWDKDV
jgi:hypothetical protein